jgi:hypothetical protein
MSSGGADRICDHPEISEIVGKLKGLRNDRYRDLAKEHKGLDFERELKKQQWYWGNRVIDPECIRDGSFPVFCPLLHLRKY